MVEVNNMTNGQTLHQMALELGLKDTIPVMPPWAELHEHSHVDPAARGKVPADYYGGKWDGMGNWPQYVMSRENAVRWDSLGANVGQKQGVTYCSLDVDVTDELLAADMRAHIEAKAASLGQVWPMRVGLAPKALWLFRVSGGEPVRRSQQALRIPNNNDPSSRQLVEIMGLSSKDAPTQAVIFGIHPSGTPYSWSARPDHNSLPLITREEIEQLRDELVEIGVRRGYESRRAHRSGDGTGSDLGAEAFDPTVIPELVNLIPNNNEEYDHWVSVGYAIKATMGATGWETFANWSAKASKADDEFTHRIWQGLKPDGSTGMGKLVFLAKAGSGGALPGPLAQRIRDGVVRKGAQVAGMPTLPPAMPAPPPMTPHTAHDVPNAPSIPTPVQQDRQHIPMALDSKDNPACCTANAVAYLWNSDIWRGVIGYDAFTDRVMIMKTLPEDDNHRVPRPIEDKDYITIQTWFQRYVWVKIKKTEITDAVALNARSNTFEPVQEYLNGLVWDGVSRIDGWLFQYAGVNAGADPRWLTYISAVGRKWLISAVARAMEPGCQVDHALILEGGQGKGKSSLLRALCPDPDWFSDSLPDFHNKDAMAHLRGKWIIEMAELTTVWGSSVEDMRRFLTRRVDEYRPSYGREEVRRPRRAVFSGTTNRNDYVKDAEGERRFWIVRSDNNLRIADIKRIRDQLWAEAVVAHRAGEVWWLSDEIEALARQVQVDRVEDDPWVDELRGLLVGKESITTSVLYMQLGLEVSNRSPAHAKRLRKAMEILGWKVHKRIMVGGKEWRPFM